MEFIFTRPIFLVALCATAYAVATFAMKTASHTPALPVLIAIAVCLASAVIAEVLLMQRFSIGIVYIGILAAETLLVLAAATFIGEGFGFKQFAGAALVLGGAALVTA